MGYGAALDNLDAILDTPGIDGLFVGPSDLSIALSGGKPLDPLSKEVEREGLDGDQMGVHAYPADEPHGEPSLGPAG